jgi:hypothetical protein
MGGNNTQRLALPRFLLLSRAILADDYLAPQVAWVDAVAAGRAVDRVGGGAAAGGAAAPLAGAARAVSHAEPVRVPIEQVKQPARVVTEQQLRDASHLRHLLHAS